MGPDLIVIVSIGLRHIPEMLFAKDHDMIAAFPPDRTDETFGWCQTNPNQSQISQTCSASGGAELTPPGESSGAAGLEIVSAGKAALSVEVVVD